MNLRLAALHALKIVELNHPNLLWAEDAAEAGQWLLAAEPLDTAKAFHIIKILDTYEALLGENDDDSAPDGQLESIDPRDAFKAIADKCNNDNAVAESLCQLKPLGRRQAARIAKKLDAFGEQFHAVESANGPREAEL